MSWTRTLSWSPQCQTLDGLNNASSTGSTPTFSTTEAHTNTYSLRPYAGASYGIEFSAVAQARIGFWIHHAGPASGDTPNIAAFKNGSGSEYLIRYLQSTSEIDLYLNGTGQVSGSNSAVPSSLSATGTWIHIGVFIDITTNPAQITLYVNGIEEWSYSGNLGTNVIGAYWSGALSTSNSWAPYIYVDDCYVDTGSGNSEEPLPAYSFIHSLPSAAGASSDFTVFPSGSGYAAVDDTTIDDDTTYVYAESAGLQDTYNFADISVAEGFSISNVFVVAHARKTSASIATTMILETYDGSYDSSAAITLSTGFERYEVGFAQDPSAADWTESTVNAAQFGIQSAGDYS
ncbi:MAG TPA: hypothetical protein PLK94_01610 [Alphaproteobacteria bacterium]|nr:hypothetical protein [Alphaproteobacteria bacterium]